MESELIDLYTGILNSLELKIDENGEIYRTSPEDQKIPVKIKQKSLFIAPLEKTQELCLAKHSLFYPVWEDGKDELPDIHQWLSNEMSFYLNNYIWKILCDFLLLIATPQVIVNEQDRKLLKLYERHISTENPKEMVITPNIELVKNFICI